MITSPSEKSQEAMNNKTLRVPPAMPGTDLPTGGTEGQVLTMGATAPEWANVPEELPEGGTQGQVLTKGSEGVEWADPATQAPYVLPMININYTGSAVTLPSDTTELSITTDMTVVETQNFTQNGIDIIADAANYKRLPMMINLQGITTRTLASYNPGFVMKSADIPGVTTWEIYGMITQAPASSPYDTPKVYACHIRLAKPGDTWNCARIDIRAIEASIGGAGGSFDYVDQYGLASDIPQLKFGFKITSANTLTIGTRYYFELGPQYTPDPFGIDPPTPGAFENTQNLYDYVMDNDIGTPGIKVNINIPNFDLYYYDSGSGGGMERYSDFTQIQGGTYTATAFKSGSYVYMNISGFFANSATTGFIYAKLQIKTNDGINWQAHSSASCFLTPILGSFST